MKARTFLITDWEPGPGEGWRPLRSYNLTHGRNGRLGLFEKGDEEMGLMNVIKDVESQVAACERHARKLDILTLSAKEMADLDYWIRETAKDLARFKTVVLRILPEGGEADGD